MDILSIVGIALAFVAILGGNLLEGGTIQALANFPAAFVVVGGTVAAAAVQTPGEIFWLAWRRIVWVVMPREIPIDENVEKIIHWAKVTRRDGLLGLENVADEERDIFSVLALELLIDGVDIHQIRQQLDLESDLIEQREIDAAKVFEAMGGYAPTIGIIGAVMGLIQVMGNLQDPSKLGNGIALAFVATIYGVALANLVLLPVAAKLRYRARREALFRQMIVDGVCAIQNGDSVRMITAKLGTYQRAVK